MSLNTVSSDWQSKSATPTSFCAREKLQVTIDKNTGNIKVQTIVQSRFQHFMSDVVRFFKLDTLQKYFVTITPTIRYEATDELRSLCENDTHLSLGEVETQIIDKTLHSGLDITQAKESVMATIKVLREGKAIWSQPNSTETLTPPIPIYGKSPATNTVPSEAEVSTPTAPPSSVGVKNETIFVSKIPFLARTLKCTCLTALMIGSGYLTYMQMRAVPIMHDNSGNPVPQDLCQFPEMTEICKGNLGISRIDMPQVEGPAKESFLKNQTVSVFHSDIQAEELVPVQSEMSYEKVMGMVEAAKQRKFDPCGGEILVASGDVRDGKIHYVIDGHHRYAACRLLGGMQQVISISATARFVLDQLATFPGVTKAAL